MTAASVTTLTCANGVNFDLLNPSVDDVDFAFICEHLAKATRYCGATPGSVYSVAQHSSNGTKAILRTTRDRLLAAYFLCHDHHEALLGDDTTPKKRALSAIMQGFGVLGPAIAQSFDLLTDQIDAVIHARAGLPWPPTPEMQAAIKHWDRVMLATEWRDLMPFAPPYDFGVAADPLPIVPHAHWTDAANEMLALCINLLPNKAT